MKVCSHCGKDITLLNQTNLERHLIKCTRIYSEKKKTEGLTMKISSFFTKKGIF